MSAHKKQKSKFKWHKKQVSLFPKVSKVVRKSLRFLHKGWNVLRPFRRKLGGALLTAITLWAICRPILHVDPFREFDPATPFSEAFRLSNDGNLPLYNLRFYCHTINVQVGINNNFMGPNQTDAYPPRVGTIPASGNITIYCPLESSIYVWDHGQPKYIQTQIAFRVRFRHLLHLLGTQACFQFLGVPDYNHKLQWTYLNNDCPTDTREYP
jgi:hypothetical protein